MASKRMFARSIIECGEFEELSMVAQMLYFRLNLVADDDGFAESGIPMAITNATSETLNELVDAGFIIKVPNRKRLYLIRGWRVHNTIDKSRYTASLYKPMLREIFKDNYDYIMSLPAFERPKDVDGKAIAPVFSLSNISESLAPAQIPATIPETAPNTLSGALSDTLSGALSDTLSGALSQYSVDKDRLDKSSVVKGSSGQLSTGKCSVYTDDDGNTYTDDYYDDVPPPDDDYCPPDDLNGGFFLYYDEERDNDTLDTKKDKGNDNKDNTTNTTTNNTTTNSDYWKPSPNRPSKNVVTNYMIAMAKRANKDVDRIDIDDEVREFYNMNDDKAKWSERSWKFWVERWVSSPKFGQAKSAVGDDGLTEYERIMLNRTYVY